MPELEAELSALRTRADSAEASASQLEEQLKVGGRSRRCGGQEALHAALSVCLLLYTGYQQAHITCDVHAASPLTAYATLATDSVRMATPKAPAPGIGGDIRFTVHAALHCCPESAAWRPSLTSACCCLLPAGGAGQVHAAAGRL